ncbi:MAG: 50S ribosomal protein L22 [Ilumatobacteraceae bacterium]
MTGPKLNEKNREPWGTKGGTRAVAKYVRMSASKARVVLDLVRDKDVQTADEILKFTDREAARVVRKVLASAVANAVENDEMQADDLFVRACFADEGPTLKRFRPRARGRAGRINKRTCHITVVVDVMSEQQIAVRDAKTTSRGGGAASRRARVAASRKATEPAQNEAPAEDNAAAATTEESES